MTLNHPNVREKAIYLHTAWKLRLRNTLRDGTSDCDLTTIRDPTICDLGLWMAKQSPATLPDYAQIANAHRLFHTAMGHTCELLRQGRAEEAKVFFSSRAGPDFASARLVHILARR